MVHFEEALRNNSLHWLHVAMVYHVEDPCRDDFVGPLLAYPKQKLVFAAHLNL